MNLETLSTDSATAICIAKVKFSNGELGLKITNPHSGQSFAAALTDFEQWFAIVKDDNATVLAYPLGSGPCFFTDPDYLIEATNIK